MMRIIMSGKRIAYCQKHWAESDFSDTEKISVGV